MIARQWHMPGAPLRASVTAANLWAFAALLALAWTARAWWRLGDGYIPKAAAVFAAIAVIVTGYVGGRHPFARYGAANQVTTMRAVLVALVTGLIGERLNPGVAIAAAGVTLAVSALDFMDGWLARRTRMTSDFGARFDMEIDAVLIMALGVLAWQYDKAGAWIVLSGLLRYLFVAAGMLWPWMDRPLLPSRRRQTVCVVQIASLNLAIVPAAAAPVSVWLAGAGLLALAASFLIDVVWLWRRA